MVVFCQERVDDNLPGLLGHCPSQSLSEESFVLVRSAVNVREEGDRDDRGVDRRKGVAGQRKKVEIGRKDDGGIKWSVCGLWVTSTSTALLRARVSNR